MADGTLKVGTITTSSGSGSITIPSGVTLSGGGIANTPAAAYYRSSTQSVSDATTTTVQFDTKVIDTHDAFSTSTYKFTVPSGEAGKYFITLSVMAYGNNNDEDGIQARIEKNGTIIARGYHQDNAGTGISSSSTASCFVIADLAVSDYLEFKGLINVGSGSPVFDGSSSNRQTNFNVFKLIGA